MVRGVICGTAISASLALLVGGGPAAGASACQRGVRHLAAVSAVGCWQRSGSTWRSRMPVGVNGMTLAGGGSVVVDNRAGTIRSTGSVRWRFGPVQVRKAPFAWRRGTGIAFTPTGAVRGLPFRGAGSILFARAKGGTTSLATRVTVPVVGGLSGDAVLTVSRNGGFDLRRIHVAVDQIPFKRLALRKLDFAYAADRWSASARVSLPGFAQTGLVLDGHVEIAGGQLVNVHAGASGLRIPLIDGFFLTAADFGVALNPLGVTGGASASFGPVLAGSSALELEGRGDYESKPEQWTANGKLSLPWLPAFQPKAEATVRLLPGRAMTLEADADLTVHGWGAHGSVRGFVTGKAFNAEGDGSLKIPGPDLNGKALFSSKGMAACGKIFFGVHVGFGYAWNGGLSIMRSSCDVGRYRVRTALRSASGATVDPTVLIDRSVPFEVFAARGADVVLKGPGGISFSSQTNRNGPDAFVTHDEEEGVAYVVVPTPPVGTYTATPTSGTLTALDAADGLSEPELGGNVTGSGSSRTLHWSVGALEPGETVSFFQGPSFETAGAEPIAETGSNRAADTNFAPEPMGPSARAVYAVVSIDGVPRLQKQLAGFDTTPPPLPTATAFIGATQGNWVLSLKRARAVSYEALIDADDGRREFRTLPGDATGVNVGPENVHVTVRITPYDAYGREGTTLLCDSAKPGACPAA